MFNKALTLPADSLILDLEDAVTPDIKTEARAQVCDWLKESDFGKQEVLVRINPLDSPWGIDDIDALLQCAPDGIVVPKVKNLKDVEAIDRLLIALEMDLGMEQGAMPLLIIGTEEASAIFNLHTTLSHERINGVAWAAEDLSASLGARARRDGAGNYLEVFSVVRSLCLLAAVASKVQPIDGPFVDIHDSEGLLRECKLTADMGYTGKLTIHPSQIEIVNQAFMPSADEIEQAEALLVAFEENQAAGRMAFSYNGEMVDVPHLKRAEGILRRAHSLKEEL
ncbi:MAG: CoA ester lyase [Gammaproteobacteria bacterium]|nr:CoA ester lyase [Gammaproteobacteria bacterium]